MISASSICCPFQCLFQFSVNDISTLRNSISKLNEQQFTDFIRLFIKNSLFKQCLHFKIKNKFVCSDGWKLLFCVSNYKWNLAMSDLNAVSIHSNLGNTHYAVWHSHVSSWFYDFFSAHCDFLSNNAIVYLPSYFTKKDVWLLAYPQLKQHNIKKAGFFDVWSSEYDNVETTEFIRMDRCDTCLQLCSATHKVYSSTEKAALAQQKNEHSYLHSHARSYLDKFRILSKDVLGNCNTFHLMTNRLLEFLILLLFLKILNAFNASNLTFMD